MAVTITRRLIWVGLCAGLILSARAHPSTYDMPFGGLVVLPEPHLRLTGRNQADYEFGRINSLDRPQVDHRFTVRNEGGAPLAITALETDCHCTTATVETIAGREPGPADAFVYYLTPGQEMVIKLTVQLARQLSGPMSHGVAIRVSGNDSPVARLHINGEMEVGLIVTPTELDFGQMILGEAHSRTVMLACDRRLLSDEALPRIDGQYDTGSGARTASFIKIISQQESQPADSVKSTSAMCIKTYLVTVQPAQTGELTARLVFAPVRPAEYRGTIPYDRAVDVFGGTLVSVRGEVTKK